MSFVWKDFVSMKRLFAWRVVLGVMLVVGLSACGKKGDLQPPPKQQLPIASMGSFVTMLEVNSGLA